MVHRLTVLGKLTPWFEAANWEPSVTIEMFLQLATQTEISQCRRILWCKAVVHFIWSINIRNSYSHVSRCHIFNKTFEYCLVWSWNSNCRVMGWVKHNEPVQWCFMRWRLQSVLPKNIWKETYGEFIYFCIVLTSEFNNTETVHLITFMCHIPFVFGVLRRNIVGLWMVCCCCRET